MLPSRELIMLVRDGTSELCQAPGEPRRSDGTHDTCIAVYGSDGNRRSVRPLGEVYGVIVVSIE
jgi:hypothetical protein